MNRRNGKTTRLVNAAIEQLFDKGKIIIPPYHSLESPDSYVKYLIEQGFVHGENVIVDEDYDVGINVQDHLFGTIVKRLKNENQYQYEIKNRIIVIRDEYRK